MHHKALHPAGAWRACAAKCMMVSMPSSFSTKFIRSALWMSPFTNCAPGHRSQPALQVALVPAHIWCARRHSNAEQPHQAAQASRTLKLDLSLTLCKFFSDEQ